MTDHLDAINENTSEINSNYNYIMQFERVIQKLNERIDELEMQVAQLSGKKTIRTEDFRNISLNSKEEELFLLLYSRTGDLLDYNEISKSTGFTQEKCRKYIAGMINKGIPIIKKYFENNTYLVLDSDFRNLQAKHNVLKIRGL